jgi:hypothetical protein
MFNHRVQEDQELAHAGSQSHSAGGCVFKDGIRQPKESPHRVPQHLNKEQILTLARQPY